MGTNDVMGMGGGDSGKEEGLPGEGAEFGERGGEGGACVGVGSGDKKRLERTE